MDEDLRKKIASLLVDLSLSKTSITKTNYEIMALIASYKTEVNRLEVIDHTEGFEDRVGARALMKWREDKFKVELSHQDANRTLKIFLSEIEEPTHE